MNIVKNTIIGISLGGTAGALGSTVFPPSAIVLVPGGMVLGGGIGACNALTTTMTSTVAKVISYSAVFALSWWNASMGSWYFNSYRAANCHVFSTDGACMPELVAGSMYATIGVGLSISLATIANQCAQYYFPLPVVTSSRKLKLVGMLTCAGGIALSTVGVPILGIPMIASGAIILHDS